MPQITLELTDNVIENDFSPLLLKIHLILSEKLPTELQNCKGRVLRHSSFISGNGDPRNAFVHLSIDVMKGRSQNLLTSIANHLMELLRDSFAASLSHLNLQLTVSIQELPEIYLKYSK